LDGVVGAPQDMMMLLIPFVRSTNSHCFLTHTHTRAHRSLTLSHCSPTTTPTTIISRSIASLARSLARRPSGVSVRASRSVLIHSFYFSFQS